jgi:hypothetical protein
MKNKLQRLSNHITVTTASTVIVSESELDPLKSSKEISEYCIKLLVMEFT